MMRPGEQQFVDMMALRGWEHQPRPERNTHETWEFRSNKSAYAGQALPLESISVDTAMHFRKNGRAVIVALGRERVVDYNGWPSVSATGMTANCMSLNAFYENIDALCGPLEAPKLPVGRDPKYVWATIRATVG